MAWTPPSSIGVMPIDVGGTGSDVVIADPTADSWAGWDGNANFSANNLLAGLDFIVSSGGTTSLTAASDQTQIVIGTDTETIEMPDVTTLKLGQSYRLVNKSTGDVTVNSSGSDLIQTMVQDTTLLLICVAITGTGTASWIWLYNPVAPFTFPLSPVLGGTGISNDALSTQTINGAYPLEWTLTGATDLTLPESGTLANQEQVQSSAFNYGTDTGTADAYIVDLDPVVGALTDGLLITFTALNQNDTNTPTLTVNGITKNIVNQSGGGVAVADITGYTPSYLMYAEQQDYWMLLNANISNMSASYFTNGVYTSGTDTGTASAYNVTLSYGAASFSPSLGTFVSFQPANNSDAAPTLTVNGAGPYQMISQNGVALPAGALLTTKFAMVTYGTNSAGQSGWILLNPQGVYIPSSRTAGFQPATVSGTSQAMVAGYAYIFNNASATTGTLPTSANSSIGDTIKIKGRSSAPWIIQANTGQIITNGATQSTTAGTATSALGTDSIQLMYVATNEWSIDWANSSAINLA